MRKQCAVPNQGKCKIAVLVLRKKQTDSGNQFKEVTQYGVF